MSFVILKYKPAYEVNIDGEKIGYIENKKRFEKSVNQNINEYKAKNINDVKLASNPEYELKLINRTQKVAESDVLIKMQEDVKMIYEYYDIYIGDEKVESLDTLEDAKNIEKEIKENKDIDIKIKEKITENIDEIKTNSYNIAKENIFKKLDIIKEEEKRTVNGIKLAVLPVEGNITSRYGERSRLRRAEHTGLDISAITGTPIKATAEGTVIFAKYCGAYGNLVKIDHGNGIETWYGHASKILVKEGQKVNAGDVVAKVGSTGNSTGPHLHFEIRIDGNHVNPQNYMY